MPLPGLAGISGHGAAAALVGGGASGVLAYHNVAQTTSGPVALNSEAYDDGWHDLSINNSRMTAGVTRLVRVIGQITASSGAGSTYLSKNGDSGTFAGTSFNTEQPEPTTTNLVSAILSVTAADYFEMKTSGSAVMLGSNSSSPFASDWCWLSVELIDAAQSYCRVSKSTTQTLTVNVHTPLTWDTEDVDTDAYHSSGSNTLFTAPATGIYRCSAHAELNAGATDLVMEFEKNSAAVIGLGRQERGGSTVGCITAPLALTIGDAMRVTIASNNAGSLTVQANGKTWAQIERLPDSYKYCLMRKNANQSAGFTSADWGKVTWQTEVADAQNWHEGVTNPNRITPTSVTEVRASFGIYQSAGADQSFMGQVRRYNSSDVLQSVVGLPGSVSGAASDDGQCGLGPWTAHTSGDYYELWVYSETGTLTVVNNEYSWFCIEGR